MFRINFTVLVTVPDFAFPETTLLQLAPHFFIESRGLPARVENGRILSQHILTLIAGDLIESGIDVDNDAVTIGDHDAFKRVLEHFSRQPQFFFCFFTTGDIATNTKHTDDLISRIQYRCFNDFQHFFMAIRLELIDFFLNARQSQSQHFLIMNVYLAGLLRRNMIVIGLAQNVISGFAHKTLIAAVAVQVNPIWIFNPDKIGNSGEGATQELVAFLNFLQILFDLLFTEPE